MCFGCYEEYYGKPTIINNKVISCSRLINNLYECEGCELGGHAHIVVDDWNLEDDNIEWCLNEAKTSEGYNWISEEGRQCGIALLTLMRSMSIPERATALAIADNFIDIQYSGE